MPFSTIPVAPMLIGITSTFLFHILWHSIWRSTYLLIFSSLLLDIVVTLDSHINYQTPFCRAIAWGPRRPWPPFGEKVQQNRPFYSPNFEDILYFLTLFNITIPRIFQPHFTWHNFISQLTCSCISIAGGSKNTNLVIPCLCIHENTKYFICFK